MIFLKILLITVVFLAFAFAGIAVKMFFKKGGEFKKSCSSVHPDTGKRLGCVCDGKSDGSCHNKEEDSVNPFSVQALETK